MKAEEYANQFKKSRRNKENPETTLRLIFRDMVREANVLVAKKKCKNPKEVARIFQAQDDKWRDMCVYLISFPINKEGFSKLLKDLSPKMYFSLIQHGFKRLKEDNLEEEK